MALATRTRRRGVEQSRLHPFLTYKTKTGLPQNELPDIIEFTCSDEYLNRPNLYPRQATILKTIFGATELFCADEATEILTKRGWMTYDRVIEGEPVLTLNHESSEAEWAPAERINVFPVQDEPLVSMEGYGHSSLTTSNHRWAVERYTGSGASGLREWRRRFVETHELGAMDRVPCAASVADLPVESVWSDVFVELVAWYWTEGHLRVGGSNTSVVITQSETANPRYVQRIRDCLTKLFGPPLDSLLRARAEAAWRETRSREMAVFVLNGRAAADLKSVAPGAARVVESSFIAALTREQLDIFIETSLDADGTRHERPSGRVHRSITQAVRERLDPLQMACSLAGIRTVLSEGVVGGSGPYAGRERWMLSFYDHQPNFTPQTRSRNFTASEVLHTGVVWCPTTRNHTWLARRDGKVYFTGNTDYDWWVLEQWANSYERTGDRGIQPDIEDRLRTLKEEERPWFREVVGVLGRRGSKGYLGAVSGAFVTWNYIALKGGDPQAYFGVARDKKLTAFVFAGKRDQAKANQWKDLVQVIMGAPCFEPYINKSLGESLSIYSLADLDRLGEMDRRGIETAMDLATFEILPKESTAMAGRGPASFMQHYDEMAHVVNSGANRSAEEVYDAATPALDQFGVYAFIFEGSSPWQMTGQFYQNYLNAIEIDPETKRAAYPDMLMLQLTSWDPYEDWERAHEIEMWPGGPKFQRLKRAIQSYDLNMQRLERANPDTFKVERRSKFASVLDAYLPTENVERLFEGWQGEQLEIQERGILSRTYKAHGDPSKSGARFGFAIAHTEPDPLDPEIKHVVFDVIHAWDPADYEDHHLDYGEVEDDLWDYLTAFMPYEMTFDQFNSASVISRFTKKVRKSTLPKKPLVYEKSATAELNWRRFEVFKTALGLDWVHAPYHEVADLELRFLQEKNTQGKFGRVNHPDSGPVQTKDVADCIVECVWSLIGDQVSNTIEMLSDVSLGGAMQGGMSTGVNETRPGQASKEVAVKEAMSQFSKARRSSPAYGAARRPRGPRA